MEEVKRTERGWAGHYICAREWKRLKENNNERS